MRNRIIGRIALAAIVALFVFALTNMMGCQAVAGLGRDLERTSLWLEGGLQNGFAR